MDKKRLKLLMTKVAKGEITREAADRLIKPKKVAQNKPVGEIKGEDKKDSKIRKKTIKLNNTGG